MSVYTTDIDSSIHAYHLRVTLLCLNKHHALTDSLKKLMHLFLLMSMSITKIVYQHMCIVK